MLTVSFLVGPLLRRSLHTSQKVHSRCGRAILLIFFIRTIRLVLFIGSGIELVPWLFFVLVSHQPCLLPVCKISWVYQKQGGMNRYARGWILGLLEDETRKWISVIDLFVVSNIKVYGDRLGHANSCKGLFSSCGIFLG